MHIRLAEQRRWLTTSFNDLGSLVDPIMPDVSVDGLGGVGLFGFRELLFGGLGLAGELEVLLHRLAR
jgi:hypothetical protein